MKFTYPAVFKKEENGRFSGRFVDLEGCEVDGYSLDDAIRNAILAEGDWIRLELLEDDETLYFMELCEHSNGFRARNF